MSKGMCFLSGNTRFAISIACGSKLLGLEVNRVVILFKSTGHITRLIRKFVTPVVGTGEMTLSKIWKTSTTMSTMRWLRCLRLNLTLIMEGVCSLFVKNF